MCGRLRESRATIANNREAISVKDASIFSLSEQLRESTATIAEKSSIIDQQGTAISIKNVDIDSLLERLEEYAVTIAERTSIIDQRDSTISENKAEIGELNIKISACKDSFSEKSNKLFHALRESSLKTVVIKSLEDKIVALIKDYELLMAQ